MYIYYICIYVFHRISSVVCLSKNDQTIGVNASLVYMGLKIVSHLHTHTYTYIVHEGITETEHIITIKSLKYLRKQPYSLAAQRRGGGGPFYTHNHICPHTVDLLMCTNHLLFFTHCAPYKTWFLFG